MTPNRFLSSRALCIPQSPEEQKPLIEPISVLEKQVMDPQEL